MKRELEETEEAEGDAKRAATGEGGDDDAAAAALSAATAVEAPEAPPPAAPILGSDTPVLAPGAAVRELVLCSELRGGSLRAWSPVTSVLPLGRV